MPARVNQESTVRSVGDLWFGSNPITEGSHLELQKVRAQFRILKSNAKGRDRTAEPLDNELEICLKLYAWHIEYLVDNEQNHEVRMIGWQSCCSGSILPLGIANWNSKLSLCWSFKCEPSWVGFELNHESSDSIVLFDLLWWTILVG